MFSSLQEYNLDKHILHAWRRQTRAHIVHRVKQSLCEIIHQLILTQPS